MTKPIILVKICYKLLYVSQGVKNSFGKVTSWPQLISEFWSHMPRGVRANVKVVRLKDGYKTRGVWGYAPPGKILHLYVLNMLFRAIFRAKFVRFI